MRADCLDSRGELDTMPTHCVAQLMANAGLRFWKAFCTRYEDEDEDDVTAVAWLSAHDTAVVKAKQEWARSIKHLPQS